jgi:non-ribosomal peptide synthetase component E (peptide arylation enzyme)
MRIVTNLTQERINDYTSRGLWGDKAISDYLDETIKKHPDKTAVVDSRGKRLTYEALGQISKKLALGFLKLGLKKEDIVSVQLPNCVEFACIYFALARIGVVLNTLAATYRHSEVRYILKFAESKIMMIPDEFRRFDYVDMMQELRTELPHLEHIFVLGENIPQGMMSFKEFCEKRWEEEPLLEALEQNKPGANDVLSLLFTSGTEAQPKGVLHTHNAIIFGEKSFGQALELTKDDVCFMPSPLTHATGFAHGVNLPMIMGQTSVTLDIWEPEEALKIIEKERCTYSMGATPFVRTLLDCPNLNKYDISAMRFFLCGGAPVPKELVMEGAKIGLKILPVYGLTESIPHVTGRLNDPPEKIYGTDGRPCPNIEVTIRDENRKALPVGKTGEEASRGANLCVGYFKRPDLNERSFDEKGWFYSGDLARMDKDGNLIIEGRKKDIIIRGGQNISVKEVEDMLLTHPKIYNVAIAAMPDRKMGEKACAFIIPQSGETVVLEEVTSYLLKNKVAKFKLPERVEIVDSFPMTPSGKIQKYVLRDQIAKKMEREAQGG